MRHALTALLCCIAGAASLPHPARAQATPIRIGFILASTGPNASIGIHYRETINLLPKTVAGHPAEYLFLDDQSDATVAVRDARRLTQEDKVDALIGSTSTPSSQGIVEVAAESHTVQMAMAPIVIPKDKFPWVFSVPQPVPLMLEGVVEDMQKRGVKTVAYIGYADAWGDVVLRGFQTDVDKLNAGIRVVASERYARNDTSVTAQALKMIAARPDAVLIGASGTPGALPQLTLVNERGFKGPVYHTHGAINREFLQIGGKGVEGAMAPTGPIIVAEQLPESNPIRKVAMAFNADYDRAYGAENRSAFAGYSYDAWVLINAAAVEALKVAQPGTAAFRQALRDSLERAKNVVGVHGIYNMTPEDHSGTDGRARVMVRVESGRWNLMP
jgi:branched-chain amino acid transport system substrate-binding protein